MLPENAIQELNYLLELHKESCSKYQELKEKTSDVQLDDFLEVTIRHTEELIKELKNKLNANQNLAYPEVLKNQLQPKIQALVESFSKSTVNEIANKIADIEKYLFERYKEVQKKDLPEEVKQLLRKHIMVIEEIFLQATVLASAGAH